MSLGNRGIQHLVDVILPRLPKPSIVSIHAADQSECQQICSHLESALQAHHSILAVEVNLSCPNVIQINVDKMLDIIAEASKLPWPIIAKIGHQQSYIDLALLAAGSCLIQAISAINSVPWGEIYGTLVSSPLEARCGQQGGVSGKLIHAHALSATRTLRTGLSRIKLGGLPIIAGGGISSKADLAQFYEAGATYYSFGSALNLPNLWPEVWRALQ